mgnify:CR=1 FL=1
MYANIKQIDPRTGKKKFNFVRTAFILSAVALPVINVLIFYFYVNLQSFTMGFQHKEASGVIVFTLENFSQFFESLGKSSSELSIAFKNTFLSWLVSVWNTILGFLASYFLYKKIPGHKFFRYIFLIPGVLAATITTAVYKELIGINGPVMQLIQKIDDIPVKLDLLNEPDYANKMVFLQMFIGGVATNLVMWGGTFARIPESVLEAAKLDGCSWHKEVTHIIVPLVWPMVALFIVLSVCGIFGAGGNVFLLTKGLNGTQTFANWMYMQVYNNPNDFNSLAYMSAVGMCVSIVAIVISFVVRRFADAAFADLQY